MHDVFTTSFCFLDSFVIGPTALDPDEGDNGRLQYSIFGTDSGKFAVDTLTGVITAKRALSGSDGSYSFTVRATDQVSQQCFHQ